MHLVDGLHWSGVREQDVLADLQGKHVVSHGSKDPCDSDAPDQCQGQTYT